MKKLCLLLLASVFMLGDVCLARADSAGKEHEMKCRSCSKSMEKCKCHKPKKEKVKKQKVKKEKAQKPKKEKVHKAKPQKAKKAKTYYAKKEKAQKVKPQKVKKVKVHKEDKKQEKKHVARVKKEKTVAKVHHRNAKVEAKKTHSKDRAKAKQVNVEQKERMLKANHLEESRRKRQDVTHERKERHMLIEKWDRAHAEAQHRDLVAGAYADVYPLPAVPTHGLWYEGKNFINASMKYDYACNAYGSDGSSSNRNITQLAFGEAAIGFDDISLAAKLVSAGKLAYAANSGVHLLTDGSTGKINFNGRDERYQLDLEIGRYIVNRDVAIGVNVPVVYNKHRLRMNPEIDRTKTGEQQLYTQASGSVVLRDLLNAKGMRDLGGSAMGMGDLSFYANYQINSVHFDKLVMGIRGVVPTAKKPSNAKLWAPELGNGGFFEANMYGSVLMNYQKYLNPFVMLEVGFCAPAHVEKRVPRKVVVSIAKVAAGGGTPTADQLAAANALLDAEGLSFRSRVAIANANGNGANNGLATAGNGHGLKAVTINEYDTTIKGFADKVQKVRMTKGAQVQFRVGNTMERFICPRGFMDVFYNFRAKGKDRATGLTTPDFDLAILERHTVELEHRFGLEYAYQHDQFTRTHLGLGYTFAGMNVPKTFELSGSLNYAF